MTDPTPLIINGSPESRCSLVLAHGAGAAMDSDFMTAMAEGLAAKNICVVRFEFPYMAQRRSAEGRRRPPDREPVLRRTLLEVIARHRDTHRGTTVFLGGKSMGGRIASLVADEAQVAGLVCLGYPFHPVGKPQQLRTAHLETLATPTLIVQGQRDTFGTKDEVATYALSPHIQLSWLPDGDHSFKPRKSSGRTLEQNWQEAIQAVAEFIQSH